MQLVTTTSDARHRAAAKGGQAAALTHRRLCQEADAVVGPLCVALRKQGRSLQQIADELTARGIRTRQGGSRWDKKQVQRILERASAGATEKNELTQQSSTRDVNPDTLLVGVEKFHDGVPPETLISTVTLTLAAAMAELPPLPATEKSVSATTPPRGVCGFVRSDSVTVTTDPAHLGDTLEEDFMSACAPLVRESAVGTVPHEGGCAWTPARWTLGFAVPAGQQVAEVLTPIGDRLVLGFADGSAPDASARRQHAGERLLAELHDAAREELAAAVDARGYQAAQEALLGLPRELALAEARVAEARAKLVRIQIDPMAAADERAEAEQAVTTAERQLSHCQGRRAQLERDAGQMQNGLARTVRETVERVTRERDTAIREELNRRLNDLAERIGDDLTTIRNLHDSLQATQRQRAVEVLTDRLLSQMQQA